MKTEWGFWRFGFGAGEQNSRYFLVSVASGAPRRRKEITRVLFSGGYKDVAVACLRQAKTVKCPALPHRGSPSQFSTVDKGKTRGGLWGRCFQRSFFCYRQLSESRASSFRHPRSKNARKRCLRAHGEVLREKTHSPTPPASPARILAFFVRFPSSYKSCSSLNRSSIKTSFWTIPLYLFFLTP